jgi:hypothetical protein
MEEVATVVVFQLEDGAYTKKFRELSQSIQIACSRLKLSLMTAGTSRLFYHKVALFDHAELCMNIKEAKERIYLTAMIYLACKVNEEVCPIRDIFSIVYLVRGGAFDLEEINKVIKISFYIQRLVLIIRLLDLYRSESRYYFN